MCERLACIIPKECLRVAHHYWGPEGYECPQWRDPSLEGTYECSYNMPPQSFCPVLVHNSQLRVKTVTERVLTSMRWGLVPSWYESNPAELKANTITCRIEAAASQEYYLPAITAGHRCIVIAEGSVSKPFCLIKWQALLLYGEKIARLISRCPLPLKRLQKRAPAPPQM
ncbi:abasic site processing protein HMCES-like [Dermacentor silvarum]|uniref:abasic site processing protein HMCES-like n=1 Tax=Dermacentor silvarum TaxID=543639 RepID=UPI002101BFB2|nr:abasic site processing protein HMCES-like [Dermacentor silvarum]